MRAAIGVLLLTGAFTMTSAFAGPAKVPPCIAMPEPEPPPAAAKPGEAPPPSTYEAGQVDRMASRADPRLTYYLYVPRHLEKNAPVFVTVHGISRNAKEHAERFAPFAERYGVVLVAPRYGRKRFPHYQCLTPDRRGLRPDAVLDQIVAEVRDMLGLADSRLYLFGFSGGGQFVHRYVMAHPQRVERAVIGAAGWYTFPDPKRPYPRGLRARDEHSPEIDPSYLRVPVEVVVGDEDIERNSALNRSAAVDKQQGRTRLERGRRWIAAMQQAAHAAGFDTPYRFETLPGVRHHFGTAMAKGNMGAAVFDFLFGARK
jgi:pimeloyl-ACP methyl ester carboxylesterase